MRRTGECTLADMNNGVAKIQIDLHSNAQPLYAFLNVLKDDLDFAVGDTVETIIRKAKQTSIILRFVEQKGFFTGIFKWLCSLAQYGMRFDHCDALTPEGRYIGAHLFGGVQELDPNYDAGKFKEEVFIRVDVTEAQSAAFFAFLRSHLHEPYDPIAITYFWGPFAGRNWHTPGAWECTQFLAEGLVACGWLPLNKRVPASKLTPRDLHYLTSTLEAMANGGKDG